MILYNNIVKISKNRWIGYILKVAFLLASSICAFYIICASALKTYNIYKQAKEKTGHADQHMGYKTFSMLNSAETEIYLAQKC